MGKVEHGQAIPMNREPFSTISTFVSCARRLAVTVDRRWSCSCYNMPSLRNCFIKRFRAAACFFLRRIEGFS